MKSDLHVSASSLRMLEACPRSWSYRYLSGYQAEDMAPNLVLGRAVHAALAVWFERLRDGAPEATLEEMREVAFDIIAEAEMGNVPILPGADDEDLRAETDRLLVAYSRQPWRPKRVLAVEEPFSLALTHHPETGEAYSFEEHVSGVFDLVIEDDDGALAVVDHKTGKRAPVADGGLDMQMAVYRWAAEEIYRPSQPVRLYHHLLMRTKVVKVELRVIPNETANVTEAIEAVASGIVLIHAAISHTNPVRLLGRRRSWRCSSCSFRRRCSEDRA